MASDLDRQLLQTDLDRIISLCTPEEVAVECDMGGDDCIAMVREWAPRGTEPKREYVIVHREDFEMMKRELTQFARRWKEIHG
jgi:hypothetical protein